MRAKNMRQLLPLGLDGLLPHGDVLRRGLLQKDQSLIPDHQNAVEAMSKMSLAVKPLQEFCGSNHKRKFPQKKTLVGLLKAKGVGGP